MESGAAELSGNPPLVKLAAPLSGGQSRGLLVALLFLLGQVALVLRHDALLDLYGVLEVFRLLGGRQSLEFVHGQDAERLGDGHACFLAEAFVFVFAGFVKSRRVVVPRPAVQPGALSGSTHRPAAHARPHWQRGSVCPWGGMNACESLEVRAL